MSSKGMSLKGKIKNYAKENNITAQVVLQNYMFECFLARLAVSQHRNNFVIKGGVLIATIVGLDTRSTMDLDTTIRNIELTAEEITLSIEQICEIDLNDDVLFRIISVNPIRKNDIYGGYCVKLQALYDVIVTHLSIDVSTGDIMTPEPIKYEFTSIFNDDINFNVLGYNIETILAEKVETILSRGVFSTRSRDYYDVYILLETTKFDRDIFKEALKATSIHRDSLEKIGNVHEIIEQIISSPELEKMWLKYQKQFIYARYISFEDTISAIKNILGV